MSKLEQIDFGAGAAELENDLGQYFYRSVAFDRAASDRTFVITGSKGAGKSTIFRMFKDLWPEIPALRLPNLWLADEPSARVHWETIVHEGLPKSLVFLWRFYLATCITRRLLEEELPENLQKLFAKFLVRWKVVAPSPTLWQSVSKLPLKIGFGDYFSTELPLKIPLAPTEVDQVLTMAESWLADKKANLWLCLDKLDEVAQSLNGGTEVGTEELLSSLMKTVSELLRLPHLRFKLFFRTDIYNALSYVNKDHFSASKMELTWSREDLAILLAHRLRVQQPEFKGQIGFETALLWINQIFDWGKPPAANFDSLYRFLMDGTENVLPRDLINFCSNSREAQLAFDRQQVHPPTAPHLISEEAIKQGLEETASSKMDDFIQVFRNFRSHFEQLRGHQSRRLTRDELAAALGTREKLDADLMIADLVRIGAMAIADKRVVNLANKFEIPPLYAMALEIGE